MSKNSNAKLVLITRPLQDADQFAAEVKGAGFVPLIEPMLGIVPIDYMKPDLKSFPAFVFTSSNAVRVFGCPDGLHEMMVFTVGMHTAEEARKQGYVRVISSEGDVMDLAAMINKKLPPGSGKILHIRGEHTALPLENLLVKDKIAVEPLVVYTAKAEDEFSPACRSALKKGEIGTVTFFSKRTAENFIKIVDKEGFSEKLPGIKVLCISDAVLDCVRGASWQEAYSAPKPDRASMIDLLKAVCL